MSKANLAGTILCGQGGALSKIKYDKELKEMYEQFFVALRSAGKEVTSLGHITEDTQVVLDKDVIAPEIYIKSANISWE